MNDSRFEEVVEDFWAALGTQVRAGDDGGLVDSREQLLQALLAQRSNTVIAFMAEVPQDLAAMCSGVVGVRDRSVARALGRLKKSEISDAVDRMRSNGGLPLSASDSSHPVALLLEDLLQSYEGRVLYRDVARILCAACEDTSEGSAALRAVLYVPPTQNKETEEEDIHGGSDD